MSFCKVLASAVLLTSALLAHAQDVSGSARILVLKSDNWSKVDVVKDKVGCISNEGRFVDGTKADDCGIFTHEPKYPYTLSTKNGNCTFSDQTQESNTDSHYGAGDHAWICKDKYAADVYDGLYTINGFPHPYLCNGDVNCYYDAKRVPDSGDDLPLWQFRWGSQQLGITPGHIQLQLLWDPVSDPPKATNKIRDSRFTVTRASETRFKGKAAQVFKA